MFAGFKVILAGGPGLNTLYRPLISFNNLSTTITLVKVGKQYVTLRAASSYSFFWLFPNVWMYIKGKYILLNGGRIVFRKDGYSSEKLFQYKVVNS